MVNIDAEALLQRIQGDRKTRIGIKVVRDIIKAQPPVPAIPLDWVMDYMATIVLEGGRNGSEITEMVRIWQKEREKEWMQLRNSQ